MPHHPPPHARLAHHLPHRSRLKLKGLRGDGHGLQRIADRLAAAPGVGSVEVRVETGSLLIHHEIPLPELLAYAKDNAVLSLKTEGTALRLLSRELSDAMASLDRNLRAATGGHVSLALCLATAFLGMAGLQVARGKAGLSTVHLLLFAMHAATLDTANPSADAQLAQEAVGELD